MFARTYAEKCPMEAKIAAKMSQTVSLERTTSMLHGRIEKLLQRQKTYDPRRRLLIALAGVPGSGKSTVSDALLRTLTSHDGITDVAVLPMASGPRLFPLDHNADVGRLALTMIGWLPSYQSDVVYL
jgi:hypothetical protein